MADPFVVCWNCHAAVDAVLSECPSCKAGLQPEGRGLSGERYREEQELLRARLGVVDPSPIKDADSANPPKRGLPVVFAVVAAAIVVGAIGLMIALSTMPCGTLGGSCGPGSIAGEPDINPDRCVDVDEATRQAIESALNIGLVEATDGGRLRLDRAEPVAWIAASSSAGFRPRVVWVAVVLDISHSHAPSGRDQWTRINDKRAVALFAADFEGNLLSYGDKFVPPNRLPLTTTLQDYTDWSEKENRDEWDSDAIASLAECAATYSPEDWLWEITW